jgi:3-oxoadipate CoA-transferase alpha subunit
MAKLFPSAEAAVADLPDGAVVAIGGYAGVGVPEALVRALAALGAKDLTCICQGSWPRRDGCVDVADLLEAGLVARLVSPMPFHPEHGGPVKAQWESGQLEIEAVPTGILAERLRAGGAGLGGVWLPTGVGTRFAEDREVREIGGRDHVFQPALKADFALLRAHAGDTLGNLVYRGAQRNWNPTIAMAASTTIVEVDELHEPGGLDPELVITQAIFIDRIVISCIEQVA